MRKFWKRISCLYCGKRINLKTDEYQKDYSDERGSGNFYFHNACLNSIEKEEEETE